MPAILELRRLRQGEIFDIVLDYLESFGPDWTTE